MKKVISFPSIDQFRGVVAAINRNYNFVGLDEQGEAIYDPSKPKPKLTFTGTIKFTEPTLALTIMMKKAFGLNPGKTLLNLKKIMLVQLCSFIQKKNLLKKCSMK